MLQQYLPFTVLKREISCDLLINSRLQQYLPFTVLKLTDTVTTAPAMGMVATVLTVYGIETVQSLHRQNQGQQVATVLTVYGIETP